MRRVGHAAQARDRGDEHQPPVVAFQQVADGGARAVEGGGEVGADDPVPAFARHLVERRALGDSGVHDQQVDRTIGGAGFVERRDDAPRVGHVALDHASTVLVGHGLERLDSSPQQRQFRAGDVQVSGGGGADSRTSASD